MIMNDKKLSIAMLSAHSCPVGDLGAKDTGGMSVYIREIARELGKMGHTVDVFTRIHDPADPIIESMGDNTRLIHLKAGKKAAINKIDVYHSLPEFISNLEKFWQDNSLSYDVTFSHYWISALVGRHLQQKYNVPYLAMYHTLGAIKNSIGIGADEPALRIESEKETMNDCRRIIVATEKEKQYITLSYNASPEKISVIPCGVNMELFRPHNKTMSREKLGLPQGKIILFVGRIDPLKGLDRLIKSLPLLKLKEMSKLVIIGGDVGSWTELEKVQKLAGELGVNGRIIFQGTVKQDILPYFYSAADVCVIPSYYESFGLVPLESLACGTPVVATDVGDLKHIIRQFENGIIIPDNSPEKLSDAISLILNHFPENTQSASVIRSSVVDWNWKGIAAKVSAEIQVVLDTRLTTIIV
jgi:D-inositol-3-phosphate glycosyltransferase